MMLRRTFSQSLAVFLLCVGLAACASGTDSNAPGLQGDAKPGTAQDFSVNVGDTVLFTPIR